MIGTLHVGVFRSEHLRRLIATLPCSRCGRSDCTIVAAHYFGPRRHLLGGGMGHKVTDVACAALCMKCHAHMDGYKDGNTWERSEEFLFLIVRTWSMLIERFDELEHRTFEQILISARGSS